MPTATVETITSAHFSAKAARYRMMAIEEDLAALAAIRTDPEKILRTEDNYRGLIVRQARYRRHASNLEKRIATAIADDAAPNPDAALIDLCNQFVANETERHLLFEHDNYAMDFGPNNARYEELNADQDRTIGMIEKCKAPVTPAGQAAIARAAVTWLDDPSTKGDDVGKDLLYKLAEGLTADFVWPPRPGSCSTAHWVDPPSQDEIDRYNADQRAWVASVDADVRAKKAYAELAERLARRGLIA